MLTSQGTRRTSSLSPLAYKMKSPMSQRRANGPQFIVEQRPFIPDPSPLPSDIEEAQETETEDDASSIAPSGMAGSVCFEEDTTRSDEESYTESEDEEEEEWEPQSKTPKAKRNFFASPSPSPKENPKASTSTLTTNPKTPWASKLAQDMDYLHLTDSAVILPRRSKGQSSAVKNDDEDGDILVKKKKRLVSS